MAVMGSSIEIIILGSGVRVPPPLPKATTIVTRRNQRSSFQRS